jgi:protein TonB
MELSRRQNLLIAGFLLLSLLLHLLLLLVPETGLLRQTEKPEPVYVEVRPPQRRDRELDLPVKPPPPKPRETPAKRLAEQDQVVKHETAPIGKDTEDTPRSVRAPRPRVEPNTPPAPPAMPTPTETRQPASALGDRPTTVQRPAPARKPSLEELTTLSPTTMARLESDWRHKYREGIAKGDTVWLDTEQDLLISFFKRFRTNIYNVWNYPEQARLREEQGECLLRIVVSRQGGIDNVELLESSGSYELDEEALRAVRKGAPYGPLPAAYPHPQLNIMAYFRYGLSKTFKYPGRISGER